MKYNLICDDSLKAVKTIESNSVNLIMSSPPYNIGKEYEVKINLDKYLENQKQLIKEFLRVLQDTGSVCWQVGNHVKNGEVFPLDIYYYDIFRSVGFKLRNRIIWHFGHGLHASKRFSGRYETILWFTKTDKYTFNLDDIRIPSKYPNKLHFKGEKKGKPSGNPLGKNPSDVWEIIKKEWKEGFFDIPNVKSNHPEKTNHPCQFPVELVERCILGLTHKNDMVLDPYCGVGSTIIASLLNERKSIGIDKDPKYLSLAKERIELLQKGNLKTRLIGTTIHKPKPTDKIVQNPFKKEEIIVCK